MVDVPSRDEHAELAARVEAVEVRQASVEDELTAIGISLESQGGAIDGLAAQLAALTARVTVLEQGGGTTDPPPSDLPSIQPVWSQSVLDTFMVNAHPSWATGVYSQTSYVEQALADLGLPSFRDRVGGGWTTKKLAQLARLAAAGVRQHATVGVLGDTEAVVRAACKTVKDHLDLFVSVGGANEPNATGAGWAAKTYQHQSWIWSELAGLLPVAGPALKDNVADVGADFRALGATGIGALVDFGDCHRYPRGDVPSNGLGERMAMSKAAFGGKSTYVTECGYNTSNSGVGEDVAAVYAPRQLLESYWLGSRRTGVFELLDQSGDPTQHAGHFGLVETGGQTDVSKWRRKPSFDAIADLASAFRDDRVTAYLPPPIRVLVDGPPDLRTIVVEKSSGATWVALWRDVPAGAPAVDVKVTTVRGISTLKVGDTWTWEPLYRQAA